MIKFCYSVCRLFSIFNIVSSLMLANWWYAHSSWSMELRKTVALIMSVILNYPLLSFLLPVSSPYKWLIFFAILDKLVFILPVTLYTLIFLNIFLISIWKYQLYSRACCTRKWALSRELALSRYFLISWFCIALEKSNFIS